MATDFTSVADDFFVNLNLQTALRMPDSRETILRFCETVQKEFPSMTSLYQRESGEYVLEADRDEGRYQWLELQAKGLTAGYFNPPSAESGYRMHRWLLERSVYFLGVSGLDVECMDLLLGFNLDFQGNRDAIVAQALLNGSPLATMGEMGAGCVECEPNLVIALDEDCCCQARLSVETRGSSYQIRTGRYDQEPISVYFTLREYPRPGELFDLQKALARECEAAEDIADRIIVPQVLQPIAAAIASA